MYWTSPRTPCSGPNSAASVTPGAARRRSARCRKRPSTLVGLTIAPTRSPRSARNCSASHTSSPVRTRIPPQRTPAGDASAAGGAQGAHRLLRRLERLEQRRRLLLPTGPVVEVGEGAGHHHVLRLGLVEVGQRLLGLRNLSRLLLHIRQLELHAGVSI